MDNTASTCINRDEVRKIQELSGKTDAEDYQIVDFANLPETQEPQKTEVKKKVENKVEKKTKPGKKQSPNSDASTSVGQCCEKGVESIKLE